MDQWEKVAAIYDRHVNDGNEPVHQAILHPLIEKGLGNYDGKEIVDFGSGNGYYDRIMAKRARKVVGIEKSKRLLSLAKKRDMPTNVRFFAGDLEGDIPNVGTFDIGVCAMVLHYIKDLNLAARNMARYIKPGGKLIITIPHPAFDKNPTPDKQSCLSAIVFDQRAKMLYWSRPLEHYVRAFEMGGFTDIRVENVFVTQAMIEKAPKWKEYLGKLRFALLTMKRST